MPQIAQQDYKYIRPVSATTVSVDAAALGQLRMAVDNGTIWDCLIANYSVNEGEGTVSMGKVLGVNKGSSGYVMLYLLDSDDGQIAGCGLSNTVIQYEGLAAIQAEENAKGYGVPDIPNLIAVNGYMQDDETSAYICVEGKYLIGYTDQYDVIEKIIKSDVDAEGRFVNITWEDAQKLIGLPINQ